MVHGCFCGAHANWIRPGYAAALARAGSRAIMPDFRGHGESGRPHDPSAYRRGVLAHDLQTLVAALALREHDIVGYSRGARVVVRMLANGA
ncbi:alpha/beta fold hydrolase [Sphingomonas phyllosphaerae]|uniref:alpha/beta fold hydrolase n=1 Tax=Sphingomonas phyllosphaerae TaxID=257003 RepID=UPI002413BD7B|nr:alpha/beta fold hydrolase [Sphingomonas phyllosphaerae]